MCPSDFIKSVKLFWWVLFYEYIHWEINAQIYLEIISNYRGNNRKG